MKTAFIYTLSDPVTGFIRYVGKANDPAKRLNAHLLRKEANPHKWNWIQKLKSQGFKPVLDIIDECDQSEWEDIERFYIAYLRFCGCDLVNLDSGGVGGRVMSAETKAKLSLCRKGKKLPPEQVAKSVAARIGKPRPEAFKEKMRAILTGKKRPAWIMERARQARLGKKQPASAVLATTQKNRERHLRKLEARRKLEELPLYD